MSRPHLPDPRSHVAAALTRSAGPVAGIRRRLFPLVSALRLVTVLGWTVFGLGIGAWIAGAWLGWRELLLMASTCLTVLVLSSAFVLGRGDLRIRMRLEPPRLSPGETARGRIEMLNRSARRRAPGRVELPVGRTSRAFEVPALSAGGSDEALFTISAERRGVIPVGPATSVRGDPIGLLRRRGVGAKRLDLLVHPRTVSLAPFGTGLLRDLEGQTTNDVSVSDLAFHSLRDYSPGDDQRHVHWRSSARSGTLLVRQFLDTRRSSVCVLVDDRISSYADDDEWELALEIAASVAKRAVRDHLDILLLVGARAAGGAVPHHVLDTLARAEPSPSGQAIAVLARRASTRSADITFVLVVTGSAGRQQDVVRAAAEFRPDVRVVAVRASTGEEPTVRQAGRTTSVYLGTLEDLQAAVALGRVA